MSDRRYWYPGADGEPAGPVPAEAIRQSLAAGLLRPASPLCVEGTEEWRAASTFPELAEAVAAAPAVVPAAPRPAVARDAPAPAPGGKPTGLSPKPYTPGARPSLPGPYVSYSQPAVEVAALFEKLRVHDEPPPPLPGARWRPRLLLCGGLLLLAIAAAVVDLAMGFPQGPFAFLIPLVAVGILLVVAATGAPRPRPEWMRAHRGPAGCVFALFGLPMLSALSTYAAGDSLSVSPIAWMVAGALVLAVAILIDNRETPGEPPRYDLSRMEDCKEIVLALEHDAMPGKPASGWLDLTGPRQGSKVCREGRAASGRQIRLYRDEWFRLTLPLRDGNRLRVSAVERVKVKEAVPRRRRTKPEVAETVATVEVKLGVNTAAYRTKPHFTPASLGESLMPGPIQTAPDSVATAVRLRGVTRFRSKDVLALLALVYARLDPVKPEAGGAA